MGIRHEARAITVYDVIVSEAAVDDAIVQTPVRHLSAVPSTIDLAGAEIELVSQFSRETRLKKALAPIRRGRLRLHPARLPPLAGIAHYQRAHGRGGAHRAHPVRVLRAGGPRATPAERLSRATEHQPGSAIHRHRDDDVRSREPSSPNRWSMRCRRYFGELVYDVIIPRTVRLSEAPGIRPADHGLRPEVQGRRVVP